MNTLSRTITWIVFIALGFVLIVVSILYNLSTLIYGVPMFIIGIFIFFNKREDEIEKIGGKK